MKPRLAVPLLLALLALTFLASLAFGELRLSFAQVLGALTNGTDEVARTVVRDFRLPRALVGLAVGAALGASGVVMQAFFRNPLASPGLLGVSSGGALGAVAVLATGPIFGFAAATMWALPLASVVGAFAATGMVLMLAQRGAGTERLLLSGVALNAPAGRGHQLPAHHHGRSLRGERADPVLAHGRPGEPQLGARVDGCARHPRCLPAAAAPGPRHGPAEPRRAERPEPGRGRAPPAPPAHRALHHPHGPGHGRGGHRGLRGPGGAPHPAPGLRARPPAPAALFHARRRHLPAGLRPRHPHLPPGPAPGRGHGPHRRPLLPVAAAEATMRAARSLESGGWGHDSVAPWRTSIPVDSAEPKPQQRCGPKGRHPFRLQTPDSRLRTEAAP
ncbi:MAG: iron chelate uptake ABC transporter family permease subunit [Holophagaceae bacterium]|nr:iron chelate uptake ABC transporter family permease subunit [Holophagaceae bacterium]